ncbi:MAG TPA: type I 3-dehydroquinate dehydratase [Pyrinomonadaceae bacterium]|jgi:3-dehydroquinate dehydratase/shikimate dehydrogenase
MNDGKICVSVCAKTADELIEQIKRAEEPADVIEIRFDCLETGEIQKAIDYLPETKKPLLFTFRPREQGGKRDLNLRERLKFWEAFLWNNRTKNFSVDFELDIDFALNLEKTNKIVSFHDFSDTSQNPAASYDVLKGRRADILKIAVQTDDVTDTIAVWKLLEKAKSEDQKIIPIAMGESGKWTRILGLAHGAFMTYAALKTGSETAPGQISAQDLKEVYRVKQLNEETEIYGIVGGNTSYSMSPYIHNAAFGFHRLNSVFVPLQVNNLEEFMRRMVNPQTREIDWKLRGFAVTIPHKIEIMRHLTFIDETAQKIGAVNTVLIVGDDKAIYGYNTDAEGFIQPLRNIYGTLTDAKTAVLGAGGAARAVCYALKKAGAKVTVFARNPEKAKALETDFNVRIENFSSQKSYRDFDILVNTTPLGMKGKAEAETPATAKQLEGLNLVYDLVYTPLQTRLLGEADKARVPKIGGLAMLIAQAAAQQKIWTGRDAPIKEMSAAALHRLS